MNLFLFIGIIFLISFILGKYFEKLRIPWIFVSMILGVVLAFYKSFSSITTSDTFETLARLGMYFLLFLVGFDLNIRKLKEKSAFIFKSAFFIIGFEGIVGTVLVHFVFGYSWIISFLVAMSFATVGEAILIPILHEFKMVNSTLGQAIIGIGTADDVIEILMLILASFIVGSRAGNTSITTVAVSLIILAILTVSFTLFSRAREKYKFLSIETMFLFILCVFFIFIGIGYYADSAPLAAVLAGVSVRLFLPDKRLALVESELKSLTYGFFAPLFFVWIGSELNIKYLLSFPLLVVLITVVSSGAKLIASYVMGVKELGFRGSMLLGVGLSVRFSTSVIIIKFLYDHNIIRHDIYSVVVASSVIFPLIIPIIFSQLVVRWKFAKKI